MAYGIRVYSTIDSSILINEDWQTMVFAGKASYAAAGATFNFSASDRAFWQRYVAPSGFDSDNPPVIFYHSIPGATFSHSRIEWVAPNWQIYFSSHASNIGAGINVYCFRRVGNLTPSTEAYGVRVFRSDGSLAFDSGLPYKLLRIKAIATAVAAVGGSITIPAGIVKPAILFHSHYARVYKSSSYYVYCSALHTQIVSTNLINLIQLDVDGKYYPYGYTGGGGTFSDGRTLSVPIIDASLYD